MVIKNAKDLSCAILTYDHRLVSTEEALPIHIMSMDKATSPNHGADSPTSSRATSSSTITSYTGGTHHADMILSMPVFFRGAPLFWVVAHLPSTADNGALFRPPISLSHAPFMRKVCISRVCGSRRTTRKSGHPKKHCLKTHSRS